jgi:hypothetical protein
MAAVIQAVSPGEDLLSVLDALCARLGVADGALQLSGALQDATLLPAPGADALDLEGPLFLVAGQALVRGGHATITGLVSWSDRGLPRVAGGALEAATSGGVDVVMHGASLAVAPAAPPDAIRAAKRPERPVRAAKPAAAPPAPEEDEDEDPHVDLSGEMEKLAPRPAPAPAPSGGWAAAVAASKPAPTPAARQAPLSPPTASDLGFDVDGTPDLVRGDVLVHPKFGRCRVVQPPVGDKVKLRRASGGLFDLHLRVCGFTRQPDEDGSRVFRVRIEGRRR